MTSPAARLAPASERSFLGVPRSAAAEIVVFYAAALVVDALLLDGTRFRDLAPHPFWLFLLVIAAHYGTAAGVFAAVLGTLLAFMGNLPPRDPLVNQSAYLLAVLGKPVLWFASAVVLGELRAGDIVKQAFGGSEVTKTREGKVVSVADDLKAASTDALKKAATLMGVALQLHGVDAPPQRVHAGPKLVEQPPEPDSPPNNRLTRKQAEFIGKLAKSNGMGRSELDELAKQHYGKSAAFLTVKEASEFISTLSTVAA